MTQNLLEPWVLLRLVAGLVAVLLFGRAAMTARKVLRHFDLRSATEGQLALERQLELAATFVRVGAVVQVLALVLSVLGADRMSRAVRGAMCAYGVFGANPWGFRSLAVTCTVALAAAVVSRIYAFDARVRSLALARSLASLTLAIAPLAVLDLALAGEFLFRLDLTAVASCCSVQLDPIAASGAVFESGPRVLSTVAAAALGGFAMASAAVASRTPTTSRVVAAGVLSLLALPAALAASVLQVAPHAFEVPSHVCPFCLLHADVLAIGYPLYGALFVAVTWAVGAAASALLARGTSGGDALASFARASLLRGAVAWGIALALGVAPIARYSLLTGGASLFPTAP